MENIKNANQFPSLRSGRPKAGQSGVIRSPSGQGCLPAPNPCTLTRATAISGAMDQFSRMFSRDLCHHDVLRNPPTARLWRDGREQTVCHCKRGETSPRYFTNTEHVAQRSLIQEVAPTVLSSLSSPLHTFAACNRIEN